MSGPCALKWRRYKEIGRLDTVQELNACMDGAWDSALGSIRGALRPRGMGSCSRGAFLRLFQGIRPAPVPLSQCGTQHYIYMLFEHDAHRYVCEFV